MTRKKETLFLYLKKGANKTTNLFCLKQSGFRPGDSCINKPLLITHDILTSLDNGLEVREVFLNTTKDFDKLRQRKTKQNGIKDKLLCILMLF